MVWGCGKWRPRNAKMDVTVVIQFPRDASLWLPALFCCPTTGIQLKFLDLHNKKRIKEHSIEKYKIVIAFNVYIIVILPYWDCNAKTKEQNTNPFVSSETSNRIKIVTTNVKRTCLSFSYCTKYLDKGILL